MFDTWKRTRAARRITRGDGHALQRFRWWQLPGRALFYLRRPDADYAVDVRHWQKQGSGGVRAGLYRDGRHCAESKLPAAFGVDGGTIEVAMSGFGIKRCHFVADDGSEHQLSPDPASAEGRRARLDNNHRAASRVIGVASTIILVTGLALLLLQLAEQISAVPPIANSVGIFTSPISLHVWSNIALGFATAIASTERSFRLRYHWLLDGAAN
ncbi:hypothetical protein [Williamsia phyllosphaerae]|uniref:Uncharacterized protein n=1 Tax=Williamsia phyllosphaerae TaxID=885042 RepID=A0ABQ1UJT4_9NOCA|nr:hypothetical protein [Williamsia phyllosphaerae]GGF20817.1 hypothetical protein GCM10007298_15950 [Williamsia phyllosphaerae]